MALSADTQRFLDGLNIEDDVLSARSLSRKGFDCEDGQYVTFSGVKMWSRK